MDFSSVLERHLRAGSLAPINDTTFDVTCAPPGAAATVRLLQGRVTVEFTCPATVPDTLPLAPVLRAQADRFGGAFYASAHQLDVFLRELALTPSH